MNLVGKIIISALAAAVAWALLQFVPVIPQILALLIATLGTALIVTLPGGASAQSTSSAKPAKAAKPPKQAPAASGPRVEGEVKWFNVSKGFGFITKDDGDELFVHFRSIRGEGRRGLRDGQRVSFIEAQTEKGPQAEDVEPL